MSLESKIEALTAAVIALTAKLEANTVAAPATVAQAPAPAPIAVPVFTAPERTTSVVPEVAPPAPVMPAPPAFAPAPPPAPAACPITDGKSLIDYVMGAYRAMGPQKGAGIQNVLTGLGYQNINDVKPEHYATLYAQVEALK